jgi:hypothetical protein
MVAVLLLQLDADVPSVQECRCDQATARSREWIQDHVTALVKASMIGRSVSTERLVFCGNGGIKKYQDC